MRPQISPLSLISTDLELNFRDLADTMPQMVWITQAEGPAVFFNRRWYEYTGLSEKQSLGFEWVTAVHPEDLEPMGTLWDQALKTKAVYESQSRFRNTLGEYRWFLNRAEPIKNAKGEVTRWFGTCTDIHDHKQLSQELHQSREQLHTAIQIRDEFLNNASHELKTPLTSLVLQLHLLNRAFKKGNLATLPVEKLQNMLATCNRQVATLQSLVSELLDTSRISQGRLTIAPERTDFSEVVSDVVERFQGYKDKEEIESCEIRVTTEKDVIGVWDRLRLEQVVVNLIDNAQKFGNGNPIEVTVSRHNGRAQLKIKDQGQGISDEYQSRIFDRFEKINSQKPARGLGLGLYICKQIVQAHGGEINVQSKPGGGSTFIVELPGEPPKHII